MKQEWRAIPRAHPESANRERGGTSQQKSFGRSLNRFRFRQSRDDSNMKCR